MSQRYRSFFRVALLLLLALISTNASSYTFDWVTLDWNPGGTGTHYYTNVGGSGVNVTVTVSGITSSFRGSPLREGDKLRLKAIFAHRNDYVAVKFTFSEPITIDNFGVYNIDSGISGSYQDAISVSANAGIQPEHGFGGDNVEWISLGNYQSYGLNLPTSDIRGVQLLSFNQLIKEFTVIYKPGTASPVSPLEQSVWLSGFTFEKPVLPTHLSVTKTANPPGGTPVKEGDKIGYTITITNDSLVKQAGISVNDPLPGSTSYVVHSTSANGYHETPSSAIFADNFETGNYSGNSGDHNFSVNWTEVDDGNHHSDPGYISGNILVARQVTNQYLQITAQKVGDQISRSLDLDSIPVTHATLTYSSCNALDEQDVIVAEVYNSQTFQWHTLQTFRQGSSTTSRVSGIGIASYDDDVAADDAVAAAAAFSGDDDAKSSAPVCNAWQGQSFDITPYKSSHTQIRFRVIDSKKNGFLFIDNVAITAVGSTVSPITKDNLLFSPHPDLVNGVPPTLLAPADGFALEPHQTMTVHYSVIVGKTGNQRSIDNTASVTSLQQTTATTGKVSNPLKGHDFGDAPLNYGHAAHLSNTPVNLYLGATKPDTEPTSQDSLTANGDDILGKDDEDGVTFTTTLVDHSVSAEVTVNNGGAASWLCGWLDINGNGAFEDTLAERHCLTIAANSQATTTLTWGSLPKDRAYTTFARFRVATPLHDASRSTGNAPDGEVEDYPVSYNFHVLDFGDTPASYGDPSHRIHQNLHIGAGDPDSENATQNSVAADADDQTGSDDENGVLFSYNAAGDALTATVTVTNVTGADAKLCGWLDGSVISTTPSGAFEANEGLCKTVSGNKHKYTLTFIWGSGGAGIVPVGDSYARFRFGSDASMGTGDSTTANKGNGEVEDYFLSATKDFGDAPLLYGIPSHGVPATPALYLGQVPPDAEGIHQPSIDAEGDDNNDTSGSGKGNDEDGFSLDEVGGLLAGKIRVFNSTGKPARLCFWFDENANGAFESSEGRCTTVTADGTSSSGDIHCTKASNSATTCTMTSNLWTQPQGSSSFARVRLTSDLNMGTTTPDGHFLEGEGTDVMYGIRRSDLGDVDGYSFAFHQVFDPVFKRPYIGKVAPDVDLDFPATNAAADYDDTHGLDDEEGVNFTSPAGTGHSIIATIVVNAQGSEPVKLCGWLDIPPVNDSFDPGEGQCMLVNPSNCQDLTVVIPGAFVCEMKWPNLPTAQAYTTYARFRISTDTSNLDVDYSDLFLRDGEVEDHKIEFDFTPTAVSIGRVGLQALPAAAFLGGLGIEQMGDTALLDMLEVWDPAVAASLAVTDRDTIVSALQHYLDPDGDGQVAVLAWETLEERGTIGFYVDRREAGDDADWIRINNDMLPGLITAPMGGEYQLADPDARSGKAYQYQLIEQEARGSTRSYGPYDLVLP